MPFCHWICSSCKQSSWDHHICLSLWAIVNVTLNWKFSCQRKKVLDENSALCGPGKNEIIEVIIISENLKWKFLAQLMSSLKTFWACHGSSKFRNAIKSILHEMWIKVGPTAHLPAIAAMVFRPVFNVELTLLCAVFLGCSSQTPYVFSTVNYRIDLRS